MTSGIKLDELLEKKVWKTYGAVSTPGKVVDLMLQISGIENWNGLDILEPGCGLCDFLSSIYDKYHHNKFTGVEVNPEILNIVRSLYPHFNLVLDDFLLWNNDCKYDLVIGNPPYGIIGSETHYPIHALNDRKKLYKKESSTWYGKYNIFGAFIEKGLNLLKQTGRLVYIVPATFMILDDFKKLRQFIANVGRVKVYYLGPKIFKGKTVSVSVLVIIRGLNGIELYEIGKLQNITKYYEKDSYAGEIVRFDTPETSAFEENTVPLGQVFTIRFAARSPEVKRHPSVSSEPKDGLVPVLTGRNLHSGWIDYQKCYSGYWMPKKEAPSLRQFYATPHLVVGHTKGGKVVAAIDDQGYPWREEIHLLPKVSGLNLTAIMEYLNSSEIDRYMRTLYKEISSHVTITQLKLIPLPLQLIKGQLL